MPADTSRAPSSGSPARLAATSTERDHHVDAILRAHIAADYPNVTILCIVRIPNAEQHPRHRVELSNGVVLVLSGPALPAITGTTVTKYASTYAEAVVLDWLAFTAEGSDRLDALSKDSCNTRSTSPFNKLRESDLKAYLPRLISYFEIEGGPSYFGPTGLRRRGISYNLTLPSPGHTIASLHRKLNEQERISVDHQIGRLLRKVAGAHSPNNQYGFAAEVLSQQPVLSAQFPREDGDQRLLSRGGHRTWSNAFEGLMQEARLEASKKKLSMPFGRLHTQFERFRGILDNVMRPQLVALRCGDHSNTLVDLVNVQAVRAHEEAISTELCTPPLLASLSPDLVKILEDDLGVVEQMETPRVTGLRDWSDLIFGDPLIAAALCQHKSSYVIRGFVGDPQTTSFSQSIPLGVIDDRRHVGIRLLLYRCYWAVRDVIRNPHSPYIKGMQKAAPSPAWKCLSNILAEIEALPDADATSGAEVRRPQLCKRRRSASPSVVNYAGAQTLTVPGPSRPEGRGCSTP